MIAADLAAAAPAGRSILVDAFAGAGGNTIAFAKTGKWKRIYAIEKNPAVLQCAKHNAKIYGVDNKITWFEGDCFEILRNQLKDLAPYSVIFASPPWGGQCHVQMFSLARVFANHVTIGPGYRTDKIFNLRTMEPYPLEVLFKEYAAFTKHMALYLPRTSDVEQLAYYVPDGHNATVKHYCMEGHSKALCVFYGDFNGP